MDFWIDVGGTFTDCVARWPDGRLTACKVLSTGSVKGRVGAGSDSGQIADPGRSEPPGFFDGYEILLLDPAGRETARGTVASSEPGRLRLSAPLPFPPEAGYELTAREPAPILAIRRALGLRRTDPLPTIDMCLGTTRGTNALLERKGARTLLITTEGFEDALRIGAQNRPRLFDLAIRKPPPLFEEAIGLRERVDARGRVLAPLDVEDARVKLRAARGRGLEAVAICLLNACANPSHEIEAGRLAREAGFREVSLSTRVSPVIKLVPRGDTTVVDAAITPVLREYVAALRAAMPSGRLRIMTSAGGLVDAGAFSGKDSLLSGPAGGVVGFAHVAREAGFARAIGFDMGGTSTDVSPFDGGFELEFEAEKAGARIAAPMLAIETVAAGGGSICGFDGARLLVGPESAGADPGPACYGRGGPMTVTDANLALGRILPDRFPFPLDRRAVDARLAEAAERVARETGRRRTAAELAEGWIRIANANMAAPIRRISVERGIDPRDHALVSFGSAGAQHACAVARLLGVRTVLVHPLAGVLSAFGVGVADIRRFAERSIQATLPDPGLDRVFEELERRPREEAAAEGAGRVRVRRLLDLRYVGQDHAISVEAGPDARARFEETHRRLYGHAFEGRPVEAVAARVEAVGERPKPAARRVEAAVDRKAEPARTSRAVFDGAERDTAVFLRERLRSGDRFEGPAIAIEDTGTVVVEPGWEARVTPEGNLELRDVEGEERCVETAASDEADPVRLELFHNAFASIATRMGTALQRTALSVNVKERLDFSCAIFTPEGELVVNAPHIPVHLGAMAECVKRLRRDLAGLAPGDVVVTNDPYRGGSHIPDVTVVTPVFDGAKPEPIFFTASRAHHAEIGGIRPGSMPPDSTTLAEEGVLLRGFKVVDAGRPRFDELEALLRAPPWPSRAPKDNLADVAAQIAANQTGADELRAMVRRHGLGTVHANMRRIQRAAGEKTRALLRLRGAGVSRFEDAMDDGSRIVVSVEIRGDGSATIDFGGTSPVVAGNLNANRAIVSSAVLYCLRCLMGEDVPLNGGVLAPVEIRVPEGCLLNPPERDDPAQCAAVVGGNVETSQRVVDVLLGALGAAAASQGTMNNLTFGNERFAYYETICGGAGAGPDFDGADAVHTHMTNTRITDAEVVESRFPARVRRFEIRRGSGGVGRRRGGDGAVREIEFLEPVEVSILSQRRTRAPYGLAGGRPGAPGRNLLRRRGSAGWEELGPIAMFRAEAGDALRIETPGGGGYGAPSTTT
jgi:5-oxoprolinase (ATP-hydrolysing)